MKNSIVDLLKDQYLKTRNPEQFDKEKFLANLYAFLVEEMNLTVDDYISNKKETLHEDIVIPKELAARERETILAQTSKETDDERLQRLVNENVFRDRIDAAKSYMQDRVVLQPHSLQVKLDYARFNLQNSDIARAEECMIELIETAGENASVEHHTLHASILLQRRRYMEAAAILEATLEGDVTHIMANLVAYMVYEKGGNALLTKKYNLISKKLVMRHLGLLPPKRGVKSGSNASMIGLNFRTLTASGEYTKQLTADQTDDMFYLLVEYFISHKLLVLAEESLKYLTNTETSKPRYFFNAAQIAYWKKEYTKAIELLEKLLDLEPRHDQGWVLKGNSHFFLGSGYDAEECYIKSLQFFAKPKRGTATMRSGMERQATMINPERVTPSGTTLSASSLTTVGQDYTIHQRLGQIYLKRRAWGDAKLVLTRCCDECPNAPAFAWLGLGIACLKLNEFPEAEDAFTQANLLDEKNADVYGYLALLCLLQSAETPGRFRQAVVCMKQALELELSLVPVIFEVADEFMRKFYELGGLEHATQLYKYILGLGTPMINVANHVQKICKEVEAPKEVMTSILGN